MGQRHKDPSRDGLLVKPMEEVPRRNMVTKRRVTMVGGLVIVAVVAACGYVDGWVPRVHGSLKAVPEEESIGMEALVVPGKNVSVPPFAEFDGNKDGVVSAEEFDTRRGNMAREGIELVQASSLPVATKESLAKNWATSYAGERDCVKRMVQIHQSTRGKISAEKFDLFYKMVSEFCKLENFQFPQDLVAPRPPQANEGQAVKCNASDPAVYRYDNGSIRWYPSPEIAGSWDPNWSRFTVIDCSKLKKGDDMAFNQPPLVDGQAVKCNASDPAVYRYDNGSIRWYPSPEIAVSWDPNWSKPTLIDCNQVTRGTQISMKLPSPEGLPDGQAIKCDPSDPAVYRLAGGERRWYPGPDIASSWDLNWSKFVVVDCSKLMKGDNMTFNHPVLVDGQAVKCGASEAAIYRYENGSIRWYPNPEIAVSWDSNWTKPVLIDCNRVTCGTQMSMKLPSPDNFPEGQAIKCDPNDLAVFRLIGDQRRWYPNPEIASSWDPNWSNFVVVNCSKLKRGDDMKFFAVSPLHVEGGQAVRCERDAAEVYRYTSGQVRLYPNPKIAASWDPKWSSTILMDCSSTPHGANMSYNQPPLTEGQAVKCNPGEPAIFRYEGDAIRLYPDPEIAASWDSKWSSPILIDCDQVTRGADMKKKLPSPEGLPEGHAIKCDSDDPAVYRLASGQRRVYPNLDIANSWDPKWSSFVVVDCTALLVGSPMKYFAVDRSNVKEGQAVKCDRDDPAVFRYTGGQVRLYPNPTIASSWDPSWSNFVVMDCSSTPHGTDMLFNQPTLVDGQAVKCDASDSAVYRYQGGVIRQYPNSEVAVSWDPSWNSSTLIDCGQVDKGAIMTKKLPPPDNLPDGQAIKCNENDTTVYRLSSGQRRPYPNSEIASSWDPTWSNFTLVDCTSLRSGEAMKFFALDPSRIQVGQSVKCDRNDSAVYRFTGTEVRWYPNVSIAMSWDRNYTNATLVDCSSTPHGVI